MGIPVGMMLRPAASPSRKRQRSLAPLNVPNTSGFGTPLFAEDKSLFYWVSEPSISEGFRNRLYPPEERQVTLDRKAPRDPVIGAERKSSTRG